MFEMILRSHTHTCALPPTNAFIQQQTPIFPAFIKILFCISYEKWLRVLCYKTVSNVLHAYKYTINNITSQRSTNIFYLRPKITSVGKTSTFCALSFLARIYTVYAIHSASVEFENSILIDTDPFLKAFWSDKRQHLSLSLLLWLLSLSIYFISCFSLCLFGRATSKR